MINSLKNISTTYTGKLRALKFIYVLNNFFQRKKLSQNKELYKELGIKKSIFSPLGKQDVLNVKGETPWLDTPHAIEKMKSHPDFNKFESNIQQGLIDYVDKGYMILKGYYNQLEVENFNLEIENLITTNKLSFNYTGKKIVESYKSSDLVNEQFFKNSKLISIFKFLFHKEVIPFHTINFIEGSEQKAHSDSIHMSTAPEGYMAAAWVALEPTDELNGPLFYYPGSHKLPYISCLDYDSGNSKFTIGDDSYAHYEEHLAEIIKQKGLKKEYFYANSGDMLIWHANLLHGGEKIKEKGRTRKSMVAHYFAKGVLCYHEISQRPALLEINHT